MPFLEQIISFIDAELKKGSLNKKKLLPAKLHGLSTTLIRNSKGSGVVKSESFPAAKDASGRMVPIALDSKYSLQVYHNLQGNTYSYEKKSYGNNYDVRCISDMVMVVICNAKISGMAKEAIEPLLIFGLPQRLSPALIAQLKISKCQVIPVSSNMNQEQVFKAEYPKAEKALVSEEHSMFSIRYKIDMTFPAACIDQCLC